MTIRQLFWMVLAAMAANSVLVPTRAAEKAGVGVPAASQVLWYDKPAGNWEQEALPIGNGRLGAMILGTVEKETIQFNEDSLWEGDEKDTGRYQNFGSVEVRVPHGKPIENYRRELDISRAVHTVTYTTDGVSYRREAFASFPDQVLVFRFTADKPGSLSGAIALADAHGANVAIEANRLTAAGKLKNGLQFESQLLVLNDGGTLEAASAGITLKGANSLTLILGAGTDYLNQRSKGWRTGETPHRKLIEQIDKAAKRPYADLVAAHVQDWQPLFDRLWLNLGSSPEAVRQLSTDKRLTAYRGSPVVMDRKSIYDGHDFVDRGKGVHDPELESLLFQFARYLMISSSRGALPANLQGLWNNSNDPPWRCDYHTDVNVQMNYWFVDQANLSECFLPYAEWLHSIRDVRRDETKRTFHVRGWTMHAENGIFGGSTWKWVNPTAAWCAQNLWDHYAFTQDKEYLRSRAYPILKELCEFWEDFLKALPNGTLVAPKGYSPEHGPEGVDGVSHDQQLVWDLFTNYIEASKALEVDPDYRKTVESLTGRLMGPKIGRWGQLQEWMKDIDDPKDTHRHLSHLIAVHPGRQISPLTTPKLAAAARVSMNARGDGSTGWSRAWKICIWARLQDGNRTYKILSGMLKAQITPNLFDTHPPFQIDGNFGYAAGVCEMLVQSHMGFIQVLPALPDAWPTGSVRGICARGGFELEMTWDKGKIVRLAVTSRVGNPCRIRSSSPLVIQGLAASTVKSPEPNVIEFETEAGKTYTLVADQEAGSQGVGGKTLDRIGLSVDKRVLHPVREKNVMGKLTLTGFYSDGSQQVLDSSKAVIQARTKAASGNVDVVAIEGDKVVPKEGGIASVEATVAEGGKTFKASTDVIVAPFYRDYHQTLVLKLFLGMEGEPAGRVANEPMFQKEHGVICTFEEALEVIRKTDNLTRRIPKIIYLVGWQKGGHDHGYPAWDEVNPRMKRKQDATALESLEWLIREARQYNTTVSLHINMVDAYKQSSLWDEYVAKDCIAKDANGQLLVAGIQMKGEDMYNVVYPREWEVGLAQRRIDRLIQMIPELKAGHTIHIDVFIAQRDNGKPISPWHAKPENGGLTPDKYVETQRRIFHYWRERGFDVTGEGIFWAHPAGEGFTGLQAMSWWYPGDRRYQMQIPECLMARGRTDRMGDGDFRFTSSMHGEEIYNKDKEKMPGFLGMFCRTTLPWYWLSRLDRLAFEDGVLSYSEGVVARTEGEKRIIRKGDLLLREDDDLFVPALWNRQEIIAYSRAGYEKKAWQLPDDWRDVKSVDLYKIALEGCLPSKKNVPVADRNLVLSLEKDEALSVVPSGARLDGRETTVSN